MTALNLSMCLPPFIPSITNGIAPSVVLLLLLKLKSALIDNSSQSVLISPDLVNFLGLTCHPLPTPEEVELAMASGMKKTCTFVDWVPLGIVSSDQSWSL